MKVSYMTIIRKNETYFRKQKLLQYRLISRI